MSNKFLLISISKNFYKFLFLALLLVPSLTLAANLKILGKELVCDPSLSPKSGGCGLGHFSELLTYLINRLTTVVVLPLAGLMLIWAGYVIMTAGGSEERVRKGKAIINTALIGVVVTLTAALIVNLITKLLT